MCFAAEQANPLEVPLFGRAMQVLMETTSGNITINLFTDTMPITAGNFLDLVQQGYYDGLHFHRVIKGFMLQAGCPFSADPNSPRAGTGGPKGGGKYTTSDGQTIVRNRGGNIPDEHPASAQFTNKVGTLSMANTGRPDSGGSQFFINTKHNDFLDWWDQRSPSAHPVFGEVVEGMDVVRTIENIRTNHSDRPKTPQQIIRCTVVE